MNDPKKKIDVNLSSLLSLKAELVRKREEARTHQNNQSRGQFHHSFPKLTEKKVSKMPISPVYEDHTLLEKSRKILESKAKFYDLMSESGGALNSDENGLVLFNQKKQADAPATQLRSYISSSEDSSSSDDSDDEYAEFTDCLGRTRRCLKKDLEKLQTQDRDLSKNMPQKIDTSAANWMINIPQAPNPPESIFSNNTSTVSKLEAQRINWEKKEGENVNKHDIHYQDVFFDEARQHGTGYYAFSTDSDERKKQQHALDDMRKKTLVVQRDKESQKLQREKIIAERVRAAKNRQRARLGLPPLEEELIPDSRIDELKEESKDERKKRKKDEKRKRRKEMEESEKSEQRKSHVRPWDCNKVEIGNSNKWQYKPDKEPMTQDQWNEMKRNERNSEFAPLNKIPRTGIEYSTYEAR